MSIKSLMITTNICKAKREHACKANKKHRIKKDEFRMEVKKERGTDKYCLDCGNKIIKKLHDDLLTLKTEFKKFYIQINDI